MTMAGYDDDEPIRRRSGWLLPLAVFVVTFALSAAILVFYLAPRPTTFAGEQPSPTSRTDRVELQVRGVHLAVPANYLIYESSRQGGKFTDISMFALLPDLHGYSSGDASDFSGNAPDSEVIYMLLREEKLELTEADRLKRIYMNYVANPNGESSPFGLTHYVFRDDSGYRAEDLFVGETDQGPVVMRCVRLSQNVVSPSCLRDVQISKRVALTYRFKRAHLADWRSIADGAEKLIQDFRKASKN
jgi:hypothetical protein